MRLFWDRWNLSIGRSLNQQLLLMWLVSMLCILGGSLHHIMLSTSIQMALTNKDQPMGVWSEIIWATSSLVSIVIWECQLPSLMNYGPRFMGSKWLVIFISIGFLWSWNRKLWSIWSSQSKLIVSMWSPSWRKPFVLLKTRSQIVLPNTWGE